MSGRLAAGRARLSGVLAHQGVRRYASNSGWLMLEQFLRAVINLGLGIYVARYLGPAEFGLFNFIVSIATVAASASRLGVDGIMVRELIARPGERALDMGTAFWLMAFGAIAASAVALLFDPSGAGTDPNSWLYLALSLTLVLVQPFTVVDLFCQAEVKAKIPAACRVAVLVIGTALRLVAIWYDQPLLAFFVILLVEQLALLVLYVGAAFVFDVPRFWGRFSAPRARQMLASSWPILVNAVAATIYIRISQILVTTLMDERSAGIFAAASRIYEAWIYVPYVCTVSLAPALLNARARSESEFHRRIVWLIGFLFWSSAGLALFFLLLGRWVLAVTFGTVYLDAHVPLVILMTASAVGALGTVSGQYFIFEKRERAVARRTLVAAATNIAGCFVLIPHMGESGAALSVLLASLAANYLILLPGARDRTLRGLIHRAVSFRFGTPRASAAP